MGDNLLCDRWAALDSAELRLLLNARIGGPGQYQDRSNNPKTFYLPLAGSKCQIKLTFDGKRIIAVERGPAFDSATWTQISAEIENCILAGSLKVGRAFSFSSFPVAGFWQGKTSQVQILPPPEGALRADLEMAENTFILEFPTRASGFWAVTEHRRMREHRTLTLLLNVLLAGRTSLQPRRPQFFWAKVICEGGRSETRWVEQAFSATLGETVTNEPPQPSQEKLREVDAESYFESAVHDGRALQVPSDLDESISCYFRLPAEKRMKFDRAAFWIDVASRQWSMSVSASFGALVSAIESLTERGNVHQFPCPKCGGSCQHEVPGATERFRSFLERHAPGEIQRARRNNMYALRSGILHGSDLMQLDQDIAFGWDPPWWNDYELHTELWRVARVALRNWLTNSG